MVLKGTGLIYCKETFI